MSNKFWKKQLNKVSQLSARLESAGNKLRASKKRLFQSNACYAYERSLRLLNNDKNNSSGTALSH